MESLNSSSSNDTQGPSPIEFSGTGGEYFKIWIVNILLTIITLGIYSAWAKVRTNQYFYSNTKLAGGVFNYHAKPMTILIGRMIAIGIFVIYSLLAEVSVVLAGILGLTLFVLMPWIIVRSMIFQARNTSFRNIRFDFNPAYREAAMIMIVWPFLVVISAGLLIPMLWHRQVKLVANNMRFGTSEFRANQDSAGPFFSIYFKLAAVILLIAVAISVFMNFSILESMIDLFESNPLFLILAYVVFLVVFLTANLLIRAYIVAKTTNLMYSKLTLEKHSFKSTLTTGGFFRQYFKHTIYTMLTLGLYIPWAKVNIVRYRLDNLKVNVAGSLDEFIGRKVEDASATGEGLGDMFEVEVGF